MNWKEGACNSQRKKIGLKDVDSGKPNQHFRRKDRLKKVTIYCLFLIDYIMKKCVNHG